MKLLGIDIGVKDGYRQLMAGLALGSVATKATSGIGSRIKYISVSYIIIKYIAIYYCIINIINIFDCIITCDSVLDGIITYITV